MSRTLVKLEDILVVNPSSWSKKEGWKYLRYLDTANITNGRIDEIVTFDTEADKIPSRARRIVHNGDFIYSTVRPNQKHYGLLKNIEENLVVSTGFAVFRSKYPEQFDTRYIYLLVTQDFLTNYLHGIAENNTSAYPALRPQDITDLEFEIPPISDQKLVADFIENLDDKIELNQKMNQTLEEIAKTIFKSWFVDFDPVRAKAEGRPTGLPSEISDLFPDELVDSEIGEIPKGWETTVLSNQLLFVLGGDWGKAEESEETPHKCRCVRGADIANLQKFAWSGMPTRYLKNSSFQKRSLQDWDIVFEISGGSPTQSTGRSVLVTEQLLNSYKTSITTSNFCRLLRFTNPKSALFHYQKFRSSYDKDEFFMYETGTTGIKNFGFKYYSEQIPYSLPPSALLNEFFEIAQPMIEKSGFNMRENMALSELRDTLLPKLISGELRIPDAEKFVEEAGV